MPEAQQEGKHEQDRTGGLVDRGRDDLERWRQFARAHQNGDEGQQPQQELNRMYDFFELPAFAHDFENIEQITQEDDTVYGIFGDHNVQRQLQPQPSRALEILGPELCQRIVQNYAWFYQSFGYVP